MKSYVLVTFAFLGAAFYVMSGGSDFVPRKADLMAAAAAQAEADARLAAEAKAATPEPAPKVVSAEVALAVKDKPAPVPGPVAVTLRADPAGTPATREAPPEITLVSLEQSGVLFARPLQQFDDQGANPATPGVFLAPAIEAPQADLRTVTGDRVNLRSGPGTDFDVVGSLVRGDEVEILQDDGIGWVRTRLADGQTAWIADFLLSAPTG